MLYVNSCGNRNAVIEFAYCTVLAAKRVVLAVQDMLIRKQRKERFLMKGNCILW